MREGLVERGEIVVLEGSRRAEELAGNALGLEAGKEVSIERALLAEIRRQVPVVPAMVPAEGHAGATSGGAGDTHGNRHGIAAAAGVAHLAGPGVQRKEGLRQLDLLRVD